jgi:polar amino acid transport system ATP-binding protein
LEQPTSGDIQVDGFDLMDPKTNINKVREHIGMVFQHFNLFPHLTVIENITLAPIDLKKVPKKKRKNKRCSFWRPSV